MSAGLWNLASFLIALIILIAVHEWGHFWVARRCGVKVLRFSLGFGKILWNRKGKDGTEYSLSLIPLGGYVKMLDERIETVPAELKSQAFNNQSVAKRTAIVAAGPLANFVFAVVAFWLVFLLGVPGVKPVIGEITPSSVAYQAGLRSGMQILKVNQQAVTDWEGVSYGFVGAAGQSEINLTVESESGVQQRIMLPLTDWNISPDEPLPFRKLGFSPLAPEILPELAQLTPGGAGEKAGLQVGDKILSVNQISVNDWQQFAKTIQQSPDIPLQLQVSRDNQTISVTLIPERRETKDRIIGFAGLMPVVKPLPEKYLTETRYGPVDAVSHALKRTAEVTKLTLDVVGKLLTGTISVDNLSGPISIAKGAGDSAGFGLVYFLGFLGLISVNLGIMNLLPLPVLDGGHLLFFGIEALLGRPVPEKVQDIAYRIGAALLMCLMAIALFNDFTRF
ncbi:sigma E protease regulator RseP [Tolumonas osonensis]|uniref:Zinc metalloprotease n=1 Tax=Tolumonas osonensis TaxID=675874 RepID=A0A841GAA6_9GAMM|nr:sigma E protease regulator RseP [Tolumonas osonensis]MBB6055988.1 regulator of sigma E protease [Tolumonas osonensis]